MKIACVQQLEAPAGMCDAWLAFSGNLSKEHSDWTLRFARVERKMREQTVVTTLLLHSGCFRPSHLLAGSSRSSEGSVFPRRRSSIGESSCAEDD